MLCIAISGSAPIIDGMAVVTVNSLHCEMTYNITAEGRDYNGTLMGPGSSYNNITTGLCPGRYMYKGMYVRILVRLVDVIM